MKFNRIIIGAAALLFSATVATNANTIEPNTNTTDAIVVKVDPKKTEISASELPATVKQAIVKGDFSKWSIAKAYKITYEGEGEMTTTDNEVEYEIHFQNAEQEKEIEVYDKDGKVVED